MVVVDYSPATGVVVKVLVAVDDALG